MTKMPDEIAEVYQLLDQEVVWLHVTWQMYRQVFGASEDTIDLLNELAPVFFRVCQDALLDQTVLALNRLTDCQRTGSRGSIRDSLSLDRLVKLIDPRQYHDLRTRVQRLWANLVKASDPLRIQRRRIAHNDLSMLRADPAFRPGISRAAIEEALAAVCALMNAVREFFDNTTVEYELVPPAGLDGEVLVAHLTSLRTYYRRHAGEPWPAAEDDASTTPYRAS